MKKLIHSLLFLFLLIGTANAQLITIDGDRDAFYDGLTGPDDGKIFMPSDCWLRDVSSAPPEGGNADLSAVVWACWEYPYLYFYAEINDDTIRVNNSSSSGSQWSNDKIELKIDPDPTLPDVSTGAMQMGVTALDTIPTNGLPAAEDPAAVDNLDQDNELQLPDGTLYAPIPEDFARRILPGGYAVEFRIHLDYLNKNDRQLPAPEEGLVFGATINVADNDLTARTHMLQWSAGHEDEAWSFPRYQGSVTLLAENKLKFEAVSPNVGQDTIINENAQEWYYNPFDFVEDKQISTVPAKFELMQNYPNPFNPSTVIRYSLQKEDVVSITIYNITGEVVRNLLSNQSKSPGTYEVVWDAKDNNDMHVNSGVYFYQLKSGTGIMTRKMIIVQ